MDSSNEGPEDFRHQLPHLFFSGDSPNNPRKCQATFGMGILTTPKPSTGWCQKSRKNEFSNLQNHPTVLRRGENLRICGGLMRPNKRSEKHQKMTSETWNSDVYKQGAMHIKHGSHHAEPERCLYTREMRVAEVQADQKKCPKYRRKPKDIWHISAPLQTIGASLPR